MKLAFAMPNMMHLKALSQPWEAAVVGPQIVRLAQLADDLGYDMIGMGEHMIIPRPHVPLSGAHYPHAAAAQGFFAGATKRIRINSSIAILPLQHPIVTAKALSTIDWLSGGRIVASFGVGWLEGEFEALGVPFHERGRMSDEYLEAIIELWTKESPEYEGKYVSFRDVAFEPKPVQKPHLPIWMGGDSEAALKRTARFASGWITFMTKPEDIPARIDFIKSQPTYKGGPFDVMCGLGTGRVGEGHKVIEDPDAQPGKSLQEIVDRLGWFSTLGVTMSAVPIPQVSGIEAYIDYVQWVIEEVKPRLD